VSPPWGGKWQCGGSGESRQVPEKKKHNNCRSSSNHIKGRKVGITTKRKEEFQSLGRGGGKDSAPVFRRIGHKKLRCDLWGGGVSGEGKRSRE